jgi:hypothetical protein
VRDGGRASIRVTSHLPLDLEIAAGAPCALTIAGKRTVGSVRPGAASGLAVTRFRLSSTDTGEADLECR